MDIPTLSRKSAAVDALRPYSGKFGRPELIHLLKRTMFGAKRSDIDALVGRSLDDVLDTLLTREPDAATLPLNHYTVGAANPDANVPFGTTWVYAADDSNLTNVRNASIQAWWTGRMIDQKTSIHQRLLVFWHNHFATNFLESFPSQSFQHLQLLDKYTLGNFKNFVRDVTYDPNMLRYLNGERNSRTAPDENYARELQELFTVGKGPGSNYNEDDVKAAAKLLTGWRSRRVAVPGQPTRMYWETYFTPGLHDTGEKKFSAFYGNKVIKGNATQNTEAEARREINEMLDMIFSQREVALHMARKLYRFFVYYDIPAQVETEVIEPLATILIQNNWEIKPVLRALLQSEHFFSAEARACFIKSPIEFSVGFAREFELAFPAENDVVNSFTARMAIFSTRNGGAATQGQTIAAPPSVAGWPAYYQEPRYHEFWITTDTFPKRLRFADAFFNTTGVSIGTNVRLIVDIVKFTEQFGADAADPNKLIERTLELLYRIPVSQSFRNYVKNVMLLDNLEDDVYWTEAWMNYRSNPTNAMFLNIVSTRLRRFYRFMIANSEYQLI
jgi:uncharacterized protein (DUF1800 family)